MAIVGDVEILQIECRNRLGVLTDPDSIVGAILLPGQVNSTPLVFVRVSIGIWENNYQTVVDGTHKWSATTTGAVARHVERHFEVEARKVP